MDRNRVSCIKKVVSWLTFACCIGVVNPSVTSGFPQQADTIGDKPLIEEGKVGRFQVSHQKISRDLFERSLRYLQAPEFMFTEKAIDDVVKDAKAEYEISVPKSYSPDKPIGVFVFISPVNSGTLSDEWYETLAANNLIAIGANNSGNRANDGLRFAFAVDAVQVLKPSYNLDHDRIYVSGFSGGGKAASMAMFAFKDTFSGGLPMGGAIPVLKMKVASSQGKMADSPEAVNITAQGLDDVKAFGRYAFMTGDSDFNNLNSKSVAKGYQEAGFKYVVHFEEANKGHARPSVESLQKGIDFVDAPLAELATERFKLAKDLATKQPGLAARYYRSAINYAADDAARETAGAQFAQLMEQYKTDLLQLESQLDNSEGESKSEKLRAFSAQWTEFANEDLLRLKSK